MAILNKAKRRALYVIGLLLSFTLAYIVNEKDASVTRSDGFEAVPHANADAPAAGGCDGCDGCDGDGSDGGDGGGSGSCTAY